MKILFLTLYPRLMPSSRYRIYQYLPYLESHGIDFDIYSAVPESLFKYLYNTGNALGNFLYLLNEAGGRLVQLLKSRFYDVVFIQKSLTAVNLRGLPVFLNDRTVILDVDDNVFNSPINNFSQAFVRRMQDKNQGAYLARISRTVIVGNKFLHDLAIQYNRSVNFIPTSLDTDRFIPAMGRLNNKVITVGWIGSPSTSAYLNSVAGALRKLSNNYQISIKIIGAPDFRMNGVNLTATPWSYETEVRQLQEFDIGIMPMLDNVWARGKCGLKVLQYMAAGIPAVCSPIGSNTEIVRDGVNGFLAYSEEEWFNKLSLLIENSQLRERLGHSGRMTVEERYSLKVNAPKLKNVIEEAVN